MNRIFAISLMAFILLAGLISCEKTGVENKDDNESQVEDVYFVKYRTDRVVGNLFYTNEEGKSVEIKSYSGAFERIVGPVNLGFQASISLPSSNVAVQTCIEVRKNDQPFLVRAEGDRRATYIVGSKTE